MPDTIATVRRFNAACAAHDMAELDAILAPEQRIVPTWHLEDGFGVDRQVLAAGGQPIAEERAA